MKITTTKLFCIPFAGGNASAFNVWKKKLSSDIEVCPFELSGHGSRFVDELYTCLSDMVDDIYGSLTKQIPKDGEYALLGYSMGTTITYEIALRLQRDGYVMPKHIFFCAQEAPQLKKNKRTYELSKKEFIEEVFKLGGTSKEVIENEELLDIYEEILRRDYEAIETYKIAGMEKVNVNSSVLYGEKDEDITDINAWREVISGDVDFHSYPAGHFFMNEFEDELLGVIKEKILN